MEDDKLLGEFYGNVNLTHSQTIMPMVESLLTQTRVALSEIGLFAVTEGPGSFTGLRIGLSAVKGMAHALGKSCVGVSTLEALAWNLSGMDAAVCPVLDARCSQVYTALFRSGGDFPERLARRRGRHPLRTRGEAEKVWGARFSCWRRQRKCAIICSKIGWQTSPFPRPR